LEVAVASGQRRSNEQEELLLRIRGWAGRTRRGDIAELSSVPENSPIWSSVTSTSDNCLGQECPAYQDCHLVEARRRAQEADLVVINHHLLCADFSLRDEGFGELLPGADCFVLDEAHQLPAVAGEFFGKTLSGRQLLELAQDAEAEYHRDAGDLPELPEQTRELVHAVRELRLALGIDARRGAWKQIADDRQVQEALQRLRERLDGLGALLDLLAGRGKGLANCRERSGALGARLSELCDRDSVEEIRWFETQRQNFRLNCTPMEIADVFRCRMENRPGAWIFTSATLAVGESFDHFCSRLGLDEAQTRRWDSPFDYTRQALWFAPRGLPDPKQPMYTQAVAELALSVLRASRGRAFLLFTSHRALQAAAAYLESRIEYPMLVQGSAPRSELLERFRELGNAVLLGTSSFWEGVDVRGSALSCVIIDKLPFASPGDPVLQARIDALRERGGNPFTEYQLPQAVISLKQGAGRLIRDAHDRGVLVVCDPRLLRRSYGRIFLSSLPPMARTRSLEEVERFFAEESGDA
jgi:ATP-dependent DNA helicase DinG